MSTDLKNAFAVDQAVQVVLKEIELSAAGFQKCSDHKATFATVMTASLGIVLALLERDFLGQEYLIWAPAALWCLYLFYWNQDFNHVVFRCSLRIAEAKMASLLGVAAFTWGRDQYELAHPRRPLKHFFNLCFAAIFGGIGCVAGFEGLRMRGAGTIWCWVFVGTLAVVFGATIHVTNEAVQRTKRRTDDLLASILKDQSWLEATISFAHQYGRTDASSQQ